MSIELIFCAIPLFGQEPVDKVMYRFTYKTDFVNDTTLRDSLGNYQYAHDEMALDVGTKVSKFYSMLWVKYYEWLDYTIKHGGEPTKDHPEPKEGASCGLPITIIPKESTQRYITRSTTS